jgi:hypothetical protein
MEEREHAEKVCDTLGRRAQIAQARGGERVQPLQAG